MEKLTVLLLVRVPSKEELIAMNLGLNFGDTLGLLEIYAFLQQQLSGLWEISEDGSANKKIIKSTSIWSSTGQAFWIDFAQIPPLEASVIRLHFQKIERSEIDVICGKPVFSFELERYPDTCPIKRLEIGAVKIGGKFIETFVFR